MFISQKAKVDNNIRCAFLIASHNFDWIKFIATEWKIRAAFHWTDSNVAPFGEYPTFQDQAAGVGKEVATSKPWFLPQGTVEKWHLACRDFDGASCIGNNFSNIGFPPKVKISCTTSFTQTVSEQFVYYVMKRLLSYLPTHIGVFKGQFLWGVFILISICHLCPKKAVYPQKRRKYYRKD